MITIDDFAKVELKIGTVITAENVEGSDRLIKLEVDLGEEKPRQVLTGMKKWYKPAFFIGKQIVVVANLEPRQMMGMRSEAMIMACGDEKPILLKPSKKVPNGTKIR